MDDRTGDLAALCRWSQKGRLRLTQAPNLKGRLRGRWELACSSIPAGQELRLIRRVLTFADDRLLSRCICSTPFAMLFFSVDLQEEP